MKHEEKDETARPSSNRLLETFVSRLNEMIGDESLRSFARRAGLSETVIRKYTKGESSPNLERLISIAEAAGVSVQWLATGEGPKRTTDYREGSYVEKGDNFIRVADIAVEVAAGNGSNGDQNEIVTSYTPFRKDWIDQEGLNPKSLAIIRAKGDSMEPLIQNGESLLVDVFTSSDGTRSRYAPETGQIISSDGIYVIRLNDHLMVKRLQLDMKGGVYIKSDNPLYDTIHITQKELEELAVVGRVVWGGRKL